MSKSCKSVPKVCCERYKQHLRAFSNNKKNYLVKRTVPSKSEKSCSTGIIRSSKGAGITTPKKTTKSDFNFSQKVGNRFDFCKKCGDIASSESNGSSNSSSKEKRNLPLKSSKNDDKTQVEQFYKNEQFKHSNQSLNTNNMKKISLQTILEQPEKLSESILNVNSDSEQICFIDPDNSETLKGIKDFREKNYFECHSAKSRVSKTSVNSLKNHECVYRFYLNERLFPVPLNTDYQGNIRCIECHLPLNTNNKKFNGTIQAKVMFGGEVQDMLLILPTDSLVMKEKRKEFKTDEDDIYFGIIKLDINGDSIFNRTLPEDSLALRYQKGYRKLTTNAKYEYKCLQNDDIIFI